MIHLKTPPHDGTAAQCKLSFKLNTFFSSGKLDWRQFVGRFFRSKNLPKELPQLQVTRRKKKKISCHFQLMRLTGKAFIVTVLGRPASLRLRRCISTKGHWFFVEPVSCGVAAGAAPPHLYWFCVFEHRGSCRQSHIHPVILKVSIPDIFLEGIVLLVVSTDSITTELILVSKQN